MNGKWFWWATGCLLSASVALSCAGKSSGSGIGGSGTGGTAGGGEPLPCTGPECGVACTGDASCSAGMHCGANGTCTRECTQFGSECPPGNVCSASGRCTAPPIIDLPGVLPGLGGGGAGTGGSSGPMSGCVKAKVNFERQIPTVVLLVDQSGSMNQTFSGGNTNNRSMMRWNILRTALMDPMNGIVSKLQSEVRFGLALYTGPQGVGQDREMPSGETCPMLVEVDVALNNYDSILASYQEDDWKFETPTGESVAKVAQKLAAFQEPGPKVIVLATDGEPDTCARPNPAAGQDVSIMAVQDAFRQGISTFVISVGNDVGESHLRNVANAGQGLPIDDPGTRFYLANSQGELESAFSSIVNGVRNCVFTLDGQVQAGFEAQGTVLLNGEPLKYEDADGWRLQDQGRQVEVVGAACTTIKDSAAPTVDISFPCGGFKPIIR